MSAAAPDGVRAAAARLAGRLVRTPVARSGALDALLGHRLLFKCENRQRVGAFKARGALNALLWLKERGALPRRAVAYSSGNHAQAVAWAARELGIEAEIYMPEASSAVKRAATEAYGARVILRASRAAMEREAEAAGAAPGCALVPPYDHDEIIHGQGTAAMEALAEHPEIEALFAPVGGGGLLSGTVLAAEGAGAGPGGAPRMVFGGEPLLANDAARTLREGRLFRWDEPQPTMADGARTLSLSERTWAIVRRAGGVFEIPEEEIAYWTQWLAHLLKEQLEPTAALGMAAAARWLHRQPPRPRRTALVILSGGNADAATMRRVWERDHLAVPPKPGG